MKEVIIFLGFAQYIPYFISMFRGRTRPSVSGWLCFALSLFVTLVASLFMGSISILVSCGMGLLCQIFIIVAGVRQGGRVHALPYGDLRLVDGSLQWGGLVRFGGCFRGHLRESHCRGGWHVLHFFENVAAPDVRGPADLGNGTSGIWPRSHSFQ